MALSGFKMTCTFSLFLCTQLPFCNLLNCTLAGQLPWQLYSKAYFTLSIVCHSLEKNMIQMCDIFII